MAKMPRQKPGKSVQVVETPNELIQHLGGFDWDLAATNENKKAPRYFGPGSLDGEDSLAINWPMSGALWLNPEFANIKPWAQKCTEHITKANAELKTAQERGNHYIALLIPAAIGTKWFREFVFDCPFASIEILQPKPIFVGHQHQFPKDMVIVTYHLLNGVPKWSYLDDWKPKAIRKGRKKVQALESPAQELS